MATSLTTRVRSLATLATLVLGGLTSSLAAGQQYEASPIDEKARLLGPIAQNCVRQPDRYATDKARFAEYFTKYYFPAMTRFQPNELAELGGLRKDLFGRYLWASRDEGLQRDLTTMAYDAMYPVAFRRAPNFHPAVRYNAVLILGMLDEKYAIEQGAGQRPPKPLAKANELLTKFVDHAASGNRVQSALVVSALIGLERHARFADQLDRGAPEAMSAAVVRLAEKDDPLPEADADVAEWARIQSASVLAKLGKSAPNAAAIGAMAKMIADETVPKMSLDGRCQVAALLATMKFDGAAVDGKAISDALLKLANDVAEDEAKEAKAFEEMNLAGGGFGGFGGASSKISKGRVKIDFQTQMMELDVRILLARLIDLRRGLNAAKPIAPADKQPVFEAAVAAIGPALTAAQSQDSVDLEVAGSVVTMANAIRAAITPGAAPIENEAEEVF